MVDAGYVRMNGGGGAFAAYVMGGALSPLVRNKCAEGQANVAWIGAVRATRRVWMQQKEELATESDAESDQGG
jgi:hypothetical protein